MPLRCPQETSEGVWSSGWQAKVPLVLETKATGEIDVAFVPHQAWTTSKKNTVERTAKISLAPMMGCKATATYVKSMLTINAVLTLEKTYTSGAVQTVKVPVMYKGSSCGNAEIKLEGIPIVPL